MINPKRYHWSQSSILSIVGSDKSRWKAPTSNVLDTEAVAKVCRNCEWPLKCIHIGSWGFFQIYGQHWMRYRGDLTFSLHLYLHDK
jgi:hypothetical protein